MTTSNTEETEYTRRIEAAPAVDPPTDPPEPLRTPSYEATYAPPAAPPPPPAYYAPPAIAYDPVPVAPSSAPVEHGEVLYVPLAVTVGDGFKFGCGFFLALAMAVLTGVLLMAALFAVTSFMGLNLPVGR